MTHHQFGGSAAAIALLVALTGCTDPALVDESAPTASSTSTEPFDDPTIVEAPPADAASQEAAVDTAEKAVAAFARPTLNSRAWYEGMLPYLSQRGADAYMGTDPATIRVTAVTGAGTVLEGSTDVLLIVQLPTDAGLYNVTMTRSDADDPWLVERIRAAGA